MVGAGYKNIAIDPNLFIYREPRQQFGGFVIQLIKLLPT